MMVMNSIARLTFVLPVPVTALTQTTEKDIITKAEETILTTGIACCTQSALWPYTDKNAYGKRFRIKQTHNAMPVLIFTIFQISSITLCCRPWPIILLTILLQVAANAHENMPNKPKIFRIVLLMDKSRSPWCSIKI